MTSQRIKRRGCKFLSGYVDTETTEYDAGSFPGILGDPGATSRDDAILSGERQFWRESLFHGLKSPWALFLTKRVLAG